MKVRHTTQTGETCSRQPLVTRRVDLLTNNSLLQRGANSRSAETRARKAGRHKVCPDHGWGQPLCFAQPAMHGGTLLEPHTHRQPHPRRALPALVEWPTGRVADIEEQHHDASKPLQQLLESRRRLLRLQAQGSAAVSGVQAGADATEAAHRASQEAARQVTPASLARP